VVFGSKAPDSSTSKARTQASIYSYCAARVDFAGAKNVLGQIQALTSIGDRLSTPAAQPDSETQATVSQTLRGCNGGPAEAVGYYEQTIPLYGHLVHGTISEPSERLRDSQIDMLLKIAAINKERGNDRQALNRVHEAASLDLGTTADKVLALGNNARDSKTFYYLLALAQYREAKKPEGEAKTNVLLGRTLVSNAAASPEDSIKDYEKAIAYFQEARKLYTGLGNNQEIADVWWAIGSAYFQLKNYDQSLVAYRSALEIATTNNDKRLQGRTLYYIAKNEESQGLKQQAIDSYSRAQTLAREVKDLTFEMNAAKALTKIKGSLNPSLAPSPRLSPAPNPAPAPESEGRLLSPATEVGRYSNGDRATARADELIFALRPCQSDRLCLYFNSSTFDFGLKAMFSNARR